MKKLLSMLLSFCVGLSIILHPFNVETVHAINGITVINDAETGYYGTLELVYTNPFSTKYNVTEYGDTHYTLEYITNQDGEITNVLIDNIKYSVDDFNAMIESQKNNINEIETSSLYEDTQKHTILDYALKYDSEVNTVDYEAINLEWKEENRINHEEHSLTNSLARCNGCGAYSPYSPPTSGYYNYPTSSYIVRGKLDSFTVALTTTAISKLATLLCAGATGPASTLMSLLAGWVADGIIDGTVNGDYGFRQTYHPVCYSAYAEERHYYVIKKDGNMKWTYEYDEYYFYRLNPF